MERLELVFPDLRGLKVLKVLLALLDRKAQLDPWVQQVLKVQLETQVLLDHKDPWDLLVRSALRDLKVLKVTLVSLALPELLAYKVELVFLEA